MLDARYAQWVEQPAREKDDKPVRYFGEIPL